MQLIEQEQRERSQERTAAAAAGGGASPQPILSPTMALAINLSTLPRPALIMCHGDASDAAVLASNSVGTGVGLARLVKRAHQSADVFAMKIVRNVSLHNTPATPLFQACCFFLSF